MFLRCCLWSLNSQLWEILDADGSNWLIFCCFCCLYKTEEDVVFTEGSTSLAAMSSVAGWTWGEAGNKHRQPQDQGKICNFFSSSLVSFWLLLCITIPALLVVLLQIKTQRKAPSWCRCLCCIPDAEGGIGSAMDRTAVSRLSSSCSLCHFSALRSGGWREESVLQ